MRKLVVLQCLAKVWNVVAFVVPYYTLRGLALVAGKNREKIWNRLPLKNMESLLILPDGNLLYCSWRDGCFWPFAIVEEIYRFQAYDRLFKPKENFTVVDLGAHIGIYALKAAKEVGKEGRVIAVEPEGRNYGLLVKNIRINKCKNVIPVKLAVSNFEGRARFYVKSLTVSHSLMRKLEIHDQGNVQVLDMTEVIVTTLSQLAKILKVAKIDLLKVDVEGVELEVLEGSDDLLSQHKISKIVIAAYHIPNRAITIKGYLEKLGYEVKIIELAGRKYVHAMSLSK